MLKQRERTTFHVTGHVVELNNHQPIANVRVEVWDKDRRYDDFVGNSQTDGAGAFAITFDPTFFAEGKHDKRPDLYFKVWQNGRLLASTEDAVIWNINAGDTDVTIEIDPADTEPSYEPITIRSFAQLMENETEILHRIEAMPNGGNLFMIHPLMLLADVGVNLTGKAQKELLVREPKLSALSDTPYIALKNSRQEQTVRFHIRGLFQKEVSS